MAEVFPHDALKLMLNDWPRGATQPAATLFVGLFTSQSPTTVLGATQVFGDLTEASGGGYARQ